MESGQAVSACIVELLILCPVGHDSNPGFPKGKRRHLVVPKPGNANRALAITEICAENPANMYCRTLLSQQFHVEMAVLLVNDDTWQVADGR
jgi:hypothetical protein